MDRSQQVLVAYRGQAPVYATLVSTGKRLDSTPPGLHRIWVKLTDDLLPGPVLSKDELEAHLIEGLNVGHPEAPIVSLKVEDPSDKRIRRR